MHEAMLYEKLEGNKVRCQVCAYRCVIPPGKHGVCQTRSNRDGTLYTLIYAEVSSAAADPIEKKPLYHFYPGSSVFSLGTFGCNFRCIHCQNYNISYVEPGTEGLLPSHHLSPEEAIRLTKRYGCQGIAWTYNEPTIWFEYTYDCARLAKPQGLYTVYVTNGFITPEALDTIGPYLDAWRVDVKGFSTAFYKKLAHLAKWQTILDMAVRAKEKWGMHVEVVTNVIPTLNDDEPQLKALAQWIVQALGAATPWHVTRFYPTAQLMNLPPTPIATLEKAMRIGKEAGLQFVYVGNVPTHTGENTYCPNCGQLDIERVGYRTRVLGVKAGKCTRCGTDLNMRGI